MSNHHQLAAILFTDIVSYTAMMQHDEEQARVIIKRHNVVLEKFVVAHQGEVMNYYGDGSLCVFSSATESVRCAMEIQKELQSEPVVPLRIGLHIGEIFFEDAKALGDGVNVASRIQSLGQANTILFSKEIFDKIKNHPEFKAVSLGYFDFKNVDESIEVFALANEGLNIPRRRQMEGKLKKKKLRSMSVLIGAALFILIGFFLVFKIFFNDPEIAVTERSIAVLPFVDMSSDKDQEYLGDGIAEEIINSLTTIRDLKIIGRTSSFQFKGQKIDLREIGEKLKAGIILEGSVQKYENTIRITAQLIRAKDNTHLWSEKYDRKLTDIFKIQDDIAANITEKLKLSLSELQ
ncbi:MAG TPA: adenylate/guanylate cyclase domain-containing protein, partial [Chitinophagaceae bacterium]